LNVSFNARTVWFLRGVSELATLLAELFLADRRVRGQIISLAPSRLSDLLNSEPDRFLILREAHITSISGLEELAEPCSIMVNRGQIYLARPLEDRGTQAARDLFAYVEKVKQ